MNSLVFRISKLEDEKYADSPVQVHRLDVFSFQRVELSGIAAKTKPHHNYFFKAKKPTNYFTASRRMDEGYRILIDFLHDKGIDKYVELPQIAVMGDTSSGKSSLLSVLSKIQFPSNAEITTRCPTRLHMEKSNNGSCEVRVSVKWHTTSTYNTDFPVKEMKKSCDPQDTEFMNFITDSIAEAQSFIMSQSQKEIASDIIEVGLKTPSCVDLTLVDLPGYVRSVGKDESSCIVQEIQNLNNEYLENERCIILAIVPANVDFHNSQILADARRVDPTTHRTIPVITKPDLIDDGAEDSILQLLKGDKTDVFEQGFHIVKCRGQKSLNDGMTIEEGLQQEQTFFRTRSPWKEYSMKENMGTDKLKTKLAMIQIEKLKAEIPRIRQELENKRSETLEETTKLGKSFTTNIERRLEYGNIIDSITTSVIHNIQGYHDKFMYTIKPKGIKFRSFIIEKSTSYTSDLLSSHLANLNSIGMGRDVTFMSGKGQRLHGVVVKRFADKKECTIKCDTNQFWTVQDNALEICHEWLHQLMKSYRDENLAVFPSITLFNRIVSDKVKEEWEPLSYEYLDDVMKELRSLLTWILDQIIPKHYSRLLSVLQHKMKAIVDDLHVACKKFIDELLAQELHPYTNNHYLFENLMKERYKKLFDKLSRVASNENGVKMIKLDVVKLTVEENQKLSYDEYSIEELKMALCAYGKVAAKRMIDTVPMTIETILLKRLASTFKDSTCILDDEMKHLFEEPKENSFKRSKYQIILKDLDQALEAFERCLEM